MIALVNHTLTRGRAGSVWLAAGFAGLLIAKVGSNTLAQLLLNYFSQRTLARLSGTLCRQILATPLRRLEQVGVPRVLTTLTDDVAVIGWATINIPTLAMNGAILIGCALYLAWLSWQVLLAVLMLVVVGALIHRLLESRAFRHLQRARETRELLFQHFRTLTEGIKELKVHAGRRREFVIERVDPTLARLQYDSMSGVRHHVVAASWNQLLFYALLGVLLFAIPPIHAVSWETLTGFVLATLYMMTPVWTIMDSWPVLARGRIALAKVRDLGISLSGPPIAESETVAMPLAAVAQLEIDGVVFAYDDDAGESFVLGPLDLSLRPNELVFLVGGNGSGKSTLMKVLTGLYPPTRGAVRLNGHLIDDKNREWYSQHFTAVFSDFYLFDSLLGLDDSGVDERARAVARAARARQQGTRGRRALLDDRALAGPAQATSAADGVSGGSADLRLRRMGGGPGCPLPRHLLSPDSSGAARAGQDGPRHQPRRPVLPSG